MSEVSARVEASPPPLSRAFWTNGAMEESKIGDHTVAVRVIDDLKELDEALAIRRRVFHEEQKVDPRHEVDGLDEECVQLLAFYNGKAAGTCRLQLMSPFVKLQRFAVDSEFRGKGIGTALLNSASAYIRSFHPELLLVALVQMTAVIPYEKAGWVYVDESNTVYEQNMAHKMMVLMPKTKDEAESLDLVKCMGANGSQLCRDVLKLFEEHRIPNMDFNKFIPTLDCAAQLVSETGLSCPTISFTISNAFDALQKGDSDRSETLSRIAMDAIWERLNIGHWKEVHVSWRWAYYLAALCRALSVIVSRNGSNAGADEYTVLKEALRICDMGLLMGMPIGEKRLADLATQIHKLLPPIDFGVSDSSSVADPSSADSDQEPVVKRRRVHGDIPQLSLTRQIPKLDSPSLETFQVDFLAQDKPCIIVGILEHWPATQKWCLPYICQTAGYRTVPVEIGSKYTEDTWSQKLMTIGEYVKRFFGKESTEVGYLAQHRLFDQIPELRNDIMVPDYCYCTAGGTSANEDDVDINAWFGPAGTVSPLHYDPRDNLLAQVLGRKYMRLYSPSATDSLYPHEGMLQNTSRVDVEKVDSEEYPKFAQAPYMECILEAGEIVFIPKKWWHYVRSLDTSFSVSFWFGDE